MTTPLFHPTLSEPGAPDHVAPLQILLAWLTRVNEWHIKRSIRHLEKGKSTRVIPPLYTSRVQVQDDGPGRCEWQDAAAAINAGAATPEALVAWRCAELNAFSHQADPVITQVWLDAPTLAKFGVPVAGDGAWTTIVRVKHRDGTLEDPAERILGRPATPRLASAQHTKPLIDLTLPDTDDDAHFAPLQIALEALTRIDEWQIRKSLEAARVGAAPMPPMLYESGVYYQEEPPGHEDWLDVWSALKQGNADCEDLAAWRCAELRVLGVPAEPVIKYQWIPREMMIKQGYPANKLPAKGLWLVHCCVRLPDGQIEDPSKILGMGGNFMQRI